MMNRFEKPSPTSSPEIRDSLFGDLPLRVWAGHAALGEPWASFTEAYDSIRSGNSRMAIDKLLAIADRDGLEPRHYLEAWHAIRDLGGEVPVTRGKILYGVVIEVSLEQGLDILAAYTDYTARYYNYSGAAVIWEHPDESMNVLIDSLLAAGRHVVTQIGPWEKERPSAPSTGHARINLLTPSGLHFGQAPLTALSADRLGGSVLQAATQLMQALIQKAGKIS